MHFLIPDNKIINKISFIILLLVVSCSSQKFTVSDHCDGERFFNTKKDLPKKNKGDYKKWREEQKLRPAWPETVVNTITPNIHSEIDSGKIAVTLINHATVLVQTKEVTFITDPIFSNTAGPLNIVGTKRVRAPSFEISQLPKIDLVLVSHNHYDHMDIRSMKKLRRKFDPLFVVPLGNKKFLKSKGFKNVIELDWWQEQTISDKIKVALAPALHWSKRKLRDYMKTLWGSFIVFSLTV